MWRCNHKVFGWPEVFSPLFRKCFEVTTSNKAIGFLEGLLQYGGCCKFTLLFVYHSENCKALNNIRKSRLGVLWCNNYAFGWPGVFSSTSWLMCLAPLSMTPTKALFRKCFETTFASNVVLKDFWNGHLNIADAANWNHWSGTIRRTQGFKQHQQKSTWEFYGVVTVRLLVTQEYFLRLVDWCVWPYYS